MKAVKILAMTLLLSTSVVFADEKLTYEDAVKMSLKNNLQIERTVDTIDELDDALETGVGDTSSVPFKTPQMIIGSSMAFQSLLDNKTLTTMTYDAQKDAIALNLKNIFLQIEYLEKNKIFLSEKMKNLQKNLDINRKKYQKGRISRIDYENAFFDVEKIKNAQKDNELQIDLAYKDLSNVLNTKNTKKIQYIDVDYKKLNATQASKENTVYKAISESPVIFSQNVQIKALEERIKYDLLDTSSTALPRDESSKSVQIQDDNLRITKQNIENAVLNTANAIETLELNIKSLEEQVINLETQTKNIKTLVKLGKKLPIDAENLEVTIAELKLNIENMKNNHSILVERYQKPYLLTLQQ